MFLSEILNSISGDAGKQHLTVSEDWLQGRATFGGLVAAVGNEAMRRLVPRDRPLRSLQTVFVGPATAKTWTMAAQVLRVGKAVTLAQCEIRDGDQVAATQVGVYGAARPTVVEFKPEPVPTPRAVDDINEVRFQPGISAAFAQHFAIRWAAGHKPFSRAPRAPTKAFIRHRDPARLTESAVIALVDCIPTPALSMFAAPAPASSLTWTLEFFEHQFDFSADAWWRIDSDICAAAGGYVNQTATLHSPDGRPVALSRQLFAIFG